MDAEVPALAPGLEPKYIAGLLLHDQVIVDAISKSTRYGKVYASKKALETLQDLSRTQFKAKYGCDCGAEDVGEMEQADIGTPI